MEDVKRIVSQNIIRLRKEKGLTQAELAGLINYSDKAVSRWETGDVVPDLETIYALSEVLGVPVSAITEEQSEESAASSPTDVGRMILSQIFLVCEIWFVLCAVFVYFKITKQIGIWQLFVWGVPATAFILWFCNRKGRSNILLLICASVFVWSLITCVYLHLLAANPWYMYFLGIPLQALIVVRYIFNYKQDLKKIRLPRKKGGNP
ncbi:MAG: helix-turn-helix transcriptional regulator [Clostridia bacterium]|nr:helix-turn-helix transcriptional regulator [Clostridia bacterium]